MIKNKKGFTIIELSAVIVIIGLLIAGASIAVINHMNKIKKRTYVQNSKAYITAITDYYTISEVTDFSNSSIYIPFDTFSEQDSNLTSVDYNFSELYYYEDHGQKVYKVSTANMNNILGKNLTGAKPIAGRVYMIYDPLGGTYSVHSATLYYDNSYKIEVECAEDNNCSYTVKKNVVQNNNNNQGGNENQGGNQNQGGSENQGGEDPAEYMEEVHNGFKIAVNGRSTAYINKVKEYFENHPNYDLQNSSVLTAHNSLLDQYGLSIYDYYASVSDINTLIGDIGNIEKPISGNIYFGLETVNNSSVLVPMIAMLTYNNGVDEAYNGTYSQSAYEYLFEPGEFNRVLTYVSDANDFYSSYTCSEAATAGHAFDVTGDGSVYAVTSDYLNPLLTNTPSNIKPVDIIASSDYLYLTCNSNNHLMVEGLSSFYYQINMNAYYRLSMSYNRTKNVYTYYITRVYEEDLSGESEEEYNDNSGGSSGQQEI